MKAFILPDYRFSTFPGMEGDATITLSLDGHKEESIIIWFGYFCDVLKDPDLNAEWTGFTKDFHLSVRTIDDSRKDVPIDLDEYIADWKQYANIEFTAPVSKECYDFILAFMEYAKREGRTIYATYW